MLITYRDVVLNEQKKGGSGVIRTTLFNGFCLLNSDLGN